VDDLIHVFTREQAVEDGVLVDVSDMAAAAGFSWPVAVTRAVWALVQDIPPRFQDIQDPEGRLWDVLWLARLAARRGGVEIRYRVVLHHGRDTDVTLKMVSGPHGPDDPRPCITIMLPDEE
jgi:hypothetical protein